MANFAAKKINIGAARNGRELGADIAGNPANRALFIVPNNGIKSVKPARRTLRFLEFRYELRLTLLKFRYFFHKSLSVLLFGFCRLIGDPEKPTVKSSHE